MRWNMGAKTRHHSQWYWVVGIFLLGLAIFFGGAGGRDARRVSRLTRGAHAIAAQTRGVRERLATLEREAGNRSGGRAQLLSVRAPQVLVNLRRAAHADGLSLGKVSVGRFLTASGATDLVKSQEPVRGWRGIAQIPVSVRGTWTTLDGLRAWVRGMRSMDAPVRHLTIAKNAFMAKIEIYGR